MSLSNYRSCPDSGDGSIGCDEEVYEGDEIGVCNAIQTLATCPFSGMFPCYIQGNHMKDVQPLYLQSDH